MEHHTEHTHTATAAMHAMARVSAHETITMWNGRLREEWDQNVRIEKGHKKKKNKRNNITMAPFEWYGN